MKTTFTIIFFLVVTTLTSAEVMIPYTTKNDGQAPSCSGGDSTQQPNEPPCSVSGTCILNTNPDNNKVNDPTCRVTDKNGRSANCTNPREYDGLCRDKDINDDPNFSFKNPHCDTDNSNTDNVELTVTKDCPASCNLYVSGSVTEARGSSLSGMPNTIDCGPTCKAGYEKLDPPSKVTLSRTIDSSCSNYTVTWSGGGCSGTGSSCTVTMDSDKTVNLTCSTTSPPPPSPSPSPSPSPIPSPPPCITSNQDHNLAGSCTPGGTPCCGNGLCQNSPSGNKCVITCFVGGTLVTLADGTRIPIEKIRAFDVVKSFDEKGNWSRSLVSKVLTHVVKAYYEVETSHGFVRATGEHPFYTGRNFRNGADSEFKALSMFKAGDSLVIDKEGVLKKTKIISIRKISEETTVYNLHNGVGPHTFVADDFIVHNK